MLMILSYRQQEEMQEAVKNAGIAYTDEQINQLAQRHLDNSQMIESKWTNELSNQQQIQKAQFREWVMKVHEDTQSSGTPSYM